MKRRYYPGDEYRQDYDLLERICAITGGHVYSIKKTSMDLAKDLGITWPIKNNGETD